MFKNLFFLSGLIVILSACDTTTDSNPETVTEDTLVTVIEIDSLAFYSQQIQANSNNSAAWANRAYYFLRQGNIKDGLIDISSAVKLDSTNTTYRMYYADLLVAALNLDDAMTHYQYVIDADSLNARAYAGIGKIYALIDNPGFATGYLNKALKIDPYIDEVYFLQGLIYRTDFYETGREESWDRALSSFQTAVEQNPNYYSAYIEMGILHDEKGNEMALDYYNAAINVAPSSTEAWYNKAMFFQTRKKLFEAKTCYRKIVGIDSIFRKAQYNQGYIQLVYDKNNDSAVFFFEKAIEIDSLYYEAFNNLGLAVERLGDLESAKKYYQKSLDINPKFTLAQDNLDYVNK